MSQPSRLFSVLGCLIFASAAFAQSGSPVVYVSGTDSTIRSVDTTGGLTTTVVSNSTEVLVVVTDNVTSDNTSTTNRSFPLYACDPTHNVQSVAPCLRASDPATRPIEAEK